jgi:hypothetical protein
MRSSMRTLAVCIAPLLWVVAACDFPRPRDVPGPGAEVTHDASLDAPPDMGVISSCTANEFIACEASIARTCNASGDGTVTQDCGMAGCNADAKRCNQCVANAATCSTSANELEQCGADGLPGNREVCLLGCRTTPVAHCAYLEPRYLPDICDVPTASGDLEVSSAVTIDTGVAANCTGGVVAQSGAPEICVVRHGSIHVAANGTLIGSGSRALALVADGAIAIDGVLDVSANAISSGPGGGGVTSGAQATSDTGGGGAGFATAGAPGGSRSADGEGGQGGDAGTNPGLLTVLVGGRRPMFVFGGNAPRSGGGGGAATLIACRGQLSVAGVIDAGGGGGQGGRPGLFAGSMWSGAGGGSGGNVVLQGASISVTGQTFANGGGGGAGWVMQGTQDGQSGSDGIRSTTTSAPGGVSFGSEGAGGAGGRLGTLPTSGKHPNSSNGLPGAGGGAIGFFQTFAPAGATIALTPSAASPGFGPNIAIETR